MVLRYAQKPHRRPAGDGPDGRGRPWDRAVKGEDIVVGAGEWTDLRVTFKVEKPFPEGWQPYIACAQEGGRFRADMFRLYEGEYVPWKPPAAGAPPAGAQAVANQQPGASGNLIANPGFESDPQQWWFNCGEKYNVRRTFRRTSFLLTRLLANMGAAASTPLLERFHNPVEASKGEKRWLDGLYLDVPQEWDYPCRFFCW